jgi:hypothetical protein
MELINSIKDAEPSVLERSYFEVEIVIAKLKRCKSPGIDQFPAELIQAGSKTLGSTVREIIWGGSDWIHLAQDRNQWAMLNTLMNFRVP